jgi:hypothetical protein
MSYVIAVPDLMTAAATDLGTIGLHLSEAHAAAVAPTVGLVPAAADEVSAGVAHLFARYAEDFHGLAGRAAVFHEQFAHKLTTGAFSYAGAEAANVASLLHPLAASAASIGSTIGVFWDQLVGQLNTFLTGFQLTGFRNMLANFLSNLEYALALSPLLIVAGFWVLVFIAGCINFFLTDPIGFLRYLWTLLTSLHL